MANAPPLNDPVAALLRGLDHDLRNPVANILGFTDLVREADGATLTGDQKMFLERIEDNCQSLLTMLEELTEAAKRLQSG